MYSPFLHMLSISRASLSSSPQALSSCSSMSHYRDSLKDMQPDGRTCNAMQIKTIQYKRKSNHYKVDDLQRRQKSGHSANVESVTVMLGRLIYQSRKEDEKGRK